MTQNDLPSSICVVFALLLGGCATTPVPYLKASMVPFPEEIMVPTKGTKSLARKTVNNGLPRQPETMEVVDMLDGRPIFRGSVFGYTGQLTESRMGTIVWTDDCPVPREIRDPPNLPNQCGWGLCYPPRMGETVRRSMYFFTSQTGCKMHEMQYEARTVGTERGQYGHVTLVNVSVALNRFVTTEWTSHVKVGQGEVFAESPRHITEYPEFAYVGTRWTVHDRQPAKASLADAAPKVKAAKETPIPCDVLAFGDSLTEGMGAAKEGAYPLQLEKLLRKSGAVVRVCNEGMSGSTTATGLARLQEIMIRKARVVVVAFGANDSLSGVQVTAIKSNLVSIINALKHSGCVVVLAGLRAPDDLDGVPKELRDAGRLYDEVAALTGSLYVPWLLEGVYLNKGFMSLDGFHPNENGYRRMAETLAPMVQKALGTIGAPTSTPVLAETLPLH